MKIEILPPGASAAEMEEFIGRLRNDIRQALIQDDETLGRCAVQVGDPEYVRLWHGVFAGTPRMPTP